MSKPHRKLIEHAGPWALAKAGLGNGAAVPVLVSRDRVTSLSGRPETAGARIVTELLDQGPVLPALAAIADDPGTAWRSLAGVTSGGASA